MEVDRGEGVTKIEMTMSKKVNLDTNGFGVN